MCILKLWAIQKHSPVVFFCAAVFTQSERSDFMSRQLLGLELITHCAWVIGRVSNSSNTLCPIFPNIKPCPTLTSRELIHADPTARTRSQVKIEYFIFPYTFTFIRLSHLYQEFCIHCIVIVNDGGMGWMGGGGVVDSHQGVSGGTGGGFYLIVSCLFVLLSFGVSCPVSF